MESDERYPPGFVIRAAPAGAPNGADLVVSSADLYTLSLVELERQIPWVSSASCRVALALRWTDCRKRITEIKRSSLHASDVVVVARRPSEGNVR